MSTQDVSIVLASKSNFQKHTNVCMHTLSWPIYNFFNFAKLMIIIGTFLLEFKNSCVFLRRVDAPLSNAYLKQLSILKDEYTLEFV